jgi:hypothetical protein
MGQAPPRLILVQATFIGQNPLDQMRSARIFRLKRLFHML